MKVKDLIKRLQKVDPNLPVVDFNFNIGAKSKICYGFSEYTKSEIIELQKVKGKKYFHKVSGKGDKYWKGSGKSFKALNLFSHGAI